MKLIYIIPFILLMYCSSVKNSQQQKEEYYFYFDANDASQFMKKYYSWPNGPLNYLYVMDKTDNIIFVSRDEKTWNNPKRIKISPKDTINLNIKNRNWLNNMTNDEKYSFFLKRANKVYHVIEKDTLNGSLYLIKNMGFSEQIE